REIDGCVRGGDITRAAALAQEALAIGPEHPGLLNLVAYQLIQDGDLDGALVRLERARILAPRDANVLNTLGNLFRRMGRHKEALEALNQAAAIDARHPTVQFNRGVVLEDLGDTPGARAAYDIAVALQPNHAEALGRLSYLAAMRGDYEAANEFAARAVAMDRNMVSALGRLSDFARQRGDVAAAVDLASRAVAERSDRPGPLMTLALAEFAAGNTKGAEEKARASLNDPGMTLTLKVIARGLIGDCRERAGDPAGAFRSYTEANEEMRRHFAPAYEAPGELRYAAWIEMIADYFAGAPAEAWRVRPEAEGSMPCRVHVFLVGFPRSGTTLLEQALGAHPEIATLSETDSLLEVAGDLLQDRKALGEFARAPESVLDARRVLYWRRALGIVPHVDGKILIDKMPLNSTLLCVVAKLFPTAKILFSLRDPRDVVFSCFRQRFEINKAMYEFLTLDGTARLYDSVMRLAETYRAKLSLAIRDTRYEDLVKDFDGHMRGICDFLGVRWNTGILDISGLARARTIKTPSGEQISKGLFDGSGNGSATRPSSHRSFPCSRRGLPVSGTRRTEPIGRPAVAQGARPMRSG
ncbi:MAG: sulfotransferase, partial [Alphaproteobacteria bacterium]